MTDLGSRLRRPIVLASASPRRRDLLRRMVREFDIVPADVEEQVREGVSPEEAAQGNARAKARHVARRLRGGTVLAADTLVAAADGGLVGKPADRDEATAILSRLSGSRHRVVTGVCLLDVASGRMDLRAATTWVTMRRMTPREIADYVASGEADGKAGAYAIQETGDRFVEKVEGSMSNVVGLPMELLEQMIMDWGMTGKEDSDEAI